MYTQVEKSKENKSKAVANSASQKKCNGKQGFEFVDNRPEAIFHNQLKTKNTHQMMMDVNSNTMQLEKVDADTGSSTFILDVINQLEEALHGSSYLPENEKKELGVEKITPYLSFLRTINRDQDKGQQQKVVKLIKSELGEGSSVTKKNEDTPISLKTNEPKPIQSMKSATPPIQRIGILGGLAVLGGIGALLLGIRRIRENNRDAAVTSNLVLGGSVVDHRGSYANVVATANLTDNRQRVEYDIRWDANCVPGGAHLGQTPGVASPGFVVDRSPGGHPVGSRTSPMARYFNDPGYTTPDGANGTYFYFLDGIEQPGTFYPPGSSWDFRLRVYGINNALLQTHIVNVPW